MVDLHESFYINNLLRENKRKERKNTSKYCHSSMLDPYFCSNGLLLQQIPPSTLTCLLQYLVQHKISLSFWSKESSIWQRDLPVCGQGWFTDSSVWEPGNKQNTASEQILLGQECEWANDADESTLWHDCLDKAHQKSWDLNTIFGLYTVSCLHC